MFRIPADMTVDPRPGAYWYIGGGTRLESWSHACQTDPNNDYCIAARKDGVTIVVYEFVFGIGRM